MKPVLTENIDKKQLQFFAMNEDLGVIVYLEE